MAFGKAQQQKRDSIFMDLKFNATKGPEGVGFRQTTSQTPSTTEGKKFDYTYAMHDYVSGHVAGFAIREEPVYDKPDTKEFIGYATMADAAGGENVVIKFPMASGAGRKLVGLLNATKESGGVVHLFTNHGAAGQQIGNKKLEKPAAYINMRKGDAKGERIVPVYADPEGKPLLTLEGKPAALPSGVKHHIAKKDIWDFAAADEVTLNTAMALTEHFSKHSQSDDQRAHESAGEAEHDGEVDLGEAAAAAAPRG